MLTIAFDGSCLADTPITGVGRALLHGLAAYAERTPHHCLLLLPPDAPSPAIAGVREVPAPRGALARQLSLPRLLRALRADVLHSAVAAIPLRARVPTLATAHDLPWRHPELLERTSPWRRLATTLSLRAATAVLAPSTFTADDVIAITQRPRAHIHVVPHGVPLATPNDPHTRRGPFLVLGDTRPRKNLARLRTAHALAAQQDATLPPLQCIGPGHDYVDEATKRTLLTNCRAVVHAAWFEGFGLPVLEGLAHGAPVACSDLPPLREIAGEHACWFDPHSTESIATALLAVHRDGALRERLARNGAVRAEQFAPARVAAAWSALHEQLAR